MIAHLPAILFGEHSMIGEIVNVTCGLLFGAFLLALCIVAGACALVGWRKPHAPACLPAYADFNLRWDSYFGVWAESNLRACDGTIDCACETCVRFWRDLNDFEESRYAAVEREPACLYCGGDCKIRDSDVRAQDAAREN